MTRRQWAFTGAAVLVALVVSIAIGSSVFPSPSTPERDEPSPTATAAPPRATATAVPEGLVTFKDLESGFSIAYPRTWKRLEPVDPEVRLLVADGTNKVSLLIRDTPTGLTVTKDTLGTVRELTDSLVGADQRVTLLSSPEAITLDELPGYRYVYTFGDRNGESGGAHVHYFVFRGKRLISLVFQVPSARALKRGSAVLDRLAGTFRAIG